MIIYLKLIVVALTAVIGWLLAALQYRPGWKDGRTTVAHQGRKVLFVVLPVALLASLVLTYADHGAAQDALREAQEFQGRLEHFVHEQRESERPELVALTVTSSKDHYILTVKNVGNRPARKVKVIFTDDSTPSAFSANLISGAGEIPKGVEYTLPLILFSGINMLMKLPNSEPGYKEALKVSMEKFNSGQMAFIPRFHLEYYFGEQKLSSPTYYLLLDSRSGLLSFGKEE